MAKPAGDLMDRFGFHPLIACWFQERFAAPTEPQRLGWPAIAAREHTLIAAPTGSGKTMAAFLACIDRLLKEALAGGLPDETRVVYVSPLRALSNDMHRNLEVPLAEILALAAAEDKHDPAAHAPVSIRVGLRTGDTTPSQRAALLRRPPHILVTTPESLYLLLTAEKGRGLLRSAETVIVDEIHALVRDKRGSHLALTLERLEALCGRPLQRIGLSATQKPIERTAAFLVGTGGLAPLGTGPPDGQNPDHRAPATWDGAEGAAAPLRRFECCRIIDTGHARALDLAIETPESELGAACLHEQWDEVHRHIVELVNAHRSTLIFVNTRRLAERVTHQLTELLGEDAVAAHHGSLSAAMRLGAERRLKAGELKAVVATASLELGLDVGYIDLVIQIGSPRSIAAFLQRIGRSGHSLGLVPKGRLFALTRDELLECMALVRAVRSGRLDTVCVPDAPLDVLAQHIVAEVASREWDAEALYALCRRSHAYRNLSREDFDRTLDYLSEGLSPSSGRSRVYLHYDRVGRRLRARKGARLAAVANAGAIPEIASYRVVAEPDNTVVGTLDEDFSVESQRGDVFLLGNTSWRILHVRGGDVTVVDAQGAPPTIPFWRGEAPGRTFELSQDVSRLREDLEQRLEPCGTRDRGAAPDPADPALEAWLAAETACSPRAAKAALDYVAAQKGAIGLLPSQRRVVFERFFDETGGMQLVVHAPFGAAINRAWGLALRKRFCRSFDFELQATADDDGFILSLGPQHSFPLESLFPMLTSANARGLLEQAVVTNPVFQIRWRWNVTRALLVLRRKDGKKVPPPLQRFRSDDLLTAVFPRLTGCQEEHTGDVEIPDHPLVRQTMDDCLTEYVDLEGLLRVLAAVERGEIQLVPRDTREPSPFCYELLNANPYAFLDGGEIQEQRVRAVSTRRSLTVESVQDLGRLDPEAIAQVCREAQPRPRSADELHDLLLSRIAVPVPALRGAQEPEVPTMESARGAGPQGAGFVDGFHPAEAEREWYRQLELDRRAMTFRLPDGRPAWVAAERLPAALAVWPDMAPEPCLTAPPGVRTDWTAAEARVALVRGLIEISGPVAGTQVAAHVGLTLAQAEAALEALEGEGVVLRGHFTPRGEGPSPAAPESEPPSAVEWCHRRLLARIHRLTIDGLRREIEPVGVDVYFRWLSRHHGLLPGERRSAANGLFEVVSMLQGIDTPAVAWERDLLPARLEGYETAWLDELCLTGEVGWGRLYPPKKSPDRGRPMAGLTRVAPISLWLRGDVDWLTAFGPAPDTDHLSGAANEVLEALSRRGAMFAADLMHASRLLPAQLDDALGELVARGLVTADGFAGLRGLIVDRSSSSGRAARRPRPTAARTRHASARTGRWSTWRRSSPLASPAAPASATVPPPLETGENPRPADRPPSGTATPDPAAVPLDDAVEQWAWQLLRRWGVVFRDLLVREAGAPRWFDLLQVYRRLEARGEVRGGRFITGVAGEQFALGETVRRLRTLRSSTHGVPGASRESLPASGPSPPGPLPTATSQVRRNVPAADALDSALGLPGELVLLCAADPLNLVGILSPHPRVPGTASNRVAYYDGVPVARLQAGELSYLDEFASLPDEVRRALARLLPERCGLTGKAMPRGATRVDSSVPAAESPGLLSDRPGETAEPEPRSAGPQPAEPRPAEPHPVERRSREQRPSRTVPRPRIS